ncbi:HDOD domain-containing protein [Chitinispirillales bacterium ANBcel5]|uniref:HDOD domain-containing protein n=1 Tax=Cellulosispirillum alkaliphilum TaxID=3039283 RepID=UPI002A52238F|nr:HDOD domain-containing protein [Chitinispirillales bacterium ANBcel5]
MNILQRLSAIDSIPTLPEVVLRVQAMIASDEGNAVMLSRIIEQDPALSSKVLKVANSSLYGTSQRITSIPIAVTRIGFNEVSHIAIAASLVKKFSRKSNLLDYKQFWRHSLTSAFLTSMVASISCIEFSPSQRQSLFLSGLLHDIGILIYDQFFHKEFEEIIDFALKKEISFLEAEHAIAPRETHAGLGAALLELWKFDQSVTSGVRFHHCPKKAPLKHKSIAAATYFSEYILCNSGLGSFEGLMSNGDKDILDYLQVPQNSLIDYLKQAETEVERSDLVLSFNSSQNSMQLRAV